MLAAWWTCNKSVVCPKKKKTYHHL